VTAFDLSAAIMREPPAAFPAAVPADLRAIILRCLAKDPARRYRTAGEVRAALQTLRLGAVTGAVAAVPLRLAAAAGGRRSVLVLPFANHSPDEGDYFSDGLTDEIIADLSAVRALRVISRTSSMRLKGSQRSMREIAADVNVEYVLEGTVRRHGGALRVTAQLIDAAADSPIWSHKYAGTFDDVFAIQETLARTIVEALELELSAEEERKMTARPIDNPEAYDTYLRARQQLHRYSHEGLEQALQHLQQGIAKTGENVLMLSAMGQVHWQYVNAGLSADVSHLDQAADYARRILAIEPESPHGHRLLGLVSVHRGDMPSAVRWLRWAVAGDPADVETHMWLALAYTVVGQPDLAAPLVAKVLDMDPLTPLYRALPAAVDVAAGRFQEAADSLAQHVEANADNSFVRMFYGLALALSGEAERALEVFAALERDLPGVPFTQLGSAFAHALRGRRAEALAAVGDDAKQAFASDPQYAHYMAQCCALAGDASAALDWAEQAVRRGFANYPLLQTHDPFLSSLRAEPRFHALLDEVQRRWQSFDV
jgi:non-specific serine/threonine protein kinase